jgi:hypothetical protein
MHNWYREAVKPTTVAANAQPVQGSSKTNNHRCHLYVERNLQVLQIYIFHNQHKRICITFSFQKQSRYRTVNAT